MPALRARGRRAGWVVALDGPSGAGKSRLAGALAERWGARLLPEAYAGLRNRPELRRPGPTGWWRTERALLAAELRRSRTAERWRRDGSRVVLDTGLVGPIAYSTGLVRLGLAPPELPVRLLATLRRGADSAAFRWPDLSVYLDVPRARAARQAAGDPTGHPPELLERHLAVARVERAIARRLAADGRLPTWFFRPPEDPVAAADRLSAGLSRRAGRPRRRTRRSVAALERAVRAELTPRASARSTGSRRSRRP